MSNRKRIQARKKISVDKQEELLNKLQEVDNQKSNETISSPKTVALPNKEKKKTPAKTQRVTVDFPQEMYNQIKEETQMNGQTLRGFIVSLVRKHLANQ